ncbi:MAG: hypothetical protein LBI68_06240 [Azoarcus sp.]|nr:hypothetical protein [Azoarcus sp.]
MGHRAAPATQARRNIGNARTLYAEPRKPFLRHRNSGGSETAGETVVA